MSMKNEVWHSIPEFVCKIYTEKKQIFLHYFNPNSNFTKKKTRVGFFLHTFPHNMINFIFMQINIDINIMTNVFS